eukprot:CAMPEP_0176218892 /NCGR_PEP_ID=MMETSP0121_2-20121125/18431_1 /TAXON_ID=160619 /ORGANISM="Kryptoperidinium foliaceum, Strain CCMP 1326" /LENGTH=218 /DNA_ID=CAMNT_0017558045 /DNA_START=149 /DNA_END=801 /DNA_ORIENTATION=+
MEVPVANGGAQSMFDDAQPLLHMIDVDLVLLVQQLGLEGQRMQVHAGRGPLHPQACRNHETQVDLVVRAPNDGSHHSIEQPGVLDLDATHTKVGAELRMLHDTLQLPEGDGARLIHVDLREDVRELLRVTDVLHVLLQRQGFDVGLRDLQRPLHEETGHDVPSGQREEYDVDHVGDGHEAAAQGQDIVDLAPIVPSGGGLQQGDHTSAHGAELREQLA